MKIIRKCVSVFLVVLFLAYGGGIGFSLHSCEHCHAVKVYVFQHPDCCPASEVEHHHKKLMTNNHKHHCSHQESESCPNDTHENSPEAYTAHCEQCCVSEFVYFKIKSDYIQSQYDRLHLEDCFTYILPFNLGWEKGKLLLFEAIDNEHFPKEKPPLLPGGERFIIFSHQLLFYA